MRWFASRCARVVRIMRVIHIARKEMEETCREARLKGLLPAYREDPPNLTRTALRPNGALYGRRLVFYSRRLPGARSASSKVRELRQATFENECSICPAKRCRGVFVS